MTATLLVARTGGVAPHGTSAFAGVPSAGSGPAASYSPSRQLLDDRIFRPLQLQRELRGSQSRREVTLQPLPLRSAPVLLGALGGQIAASYSFQKFFPLFAIIA